MEFQVNQTKVYEHLGHPVYLSSSICVTLLSIVGEDSDSSEDDVEIVDETSIRGEELESSDYTQRQAQLSEPSPDLERLVGGRQVEAQQVLPVAEEEEAEEDDDLIWGEDFGEMPIDIAEQGRFYIGGWLAKKLRHKFPTLECLGGAAMGYPTDQVPQNYGPIPAWIGIQSRGGLCTPTPELMQLVHKFDLIFATMHGKTISEQPKVIKTLFDNVRRSHPEVPSPIVLKYSRFRTFLRKRYLSDQLNSAKREEARIRAEKRAKKNADGTVSINAAAANAMLGESARIRNRRKAKQNSGRV